VLGLCGCTGSLAGTSGPGAPTVQSPAGGQNPSASAGWTPTATPTTPTPSTPATTPTDTPTGDPHPLAGRTIVVDPGHNAIWTKALRRPVPAGNGRTKACNSSGTATNDGWGEHAYNWVQAQALVRQLEDRGAKIVLTRLDDNGSGPCVNLRAAAANTNNADLIISIHADGSFTGGARGYHIIVSTTMDGGPAVERTSLRLAREVRRRMDTTEMPRSTYIGAGTAFSPRTDIATLNLSEHPGVMMEMGNMRNADDVALLRSKEFRRAAAVALAEAAVAVLD
jgi:N-acetylmuramoyl-L-alanine amidase